MLMMVRQPAAAEEVTQDTFVRAFTHLDRYDDQQPFYPWMAAIAVRLAQNRLRQHGRTVSGRAPRSRDVDEPGASNRGR